MVRKTRADHNSANAGKSEVLGGSSSRANDINDSGQVVGQSNTGDGPSHAFTTGHNGMGMTDLGTLGGSSSAAYGINDSGQVVGNSDTADGSSHAFITGPNGMGMTDLNSIVDLPEGRFLINAVGINNEGQVIATIIPEPASYALMLAGLGLIGFMARSKKQAAQVSVRQRRFDFNHPALRHILTPLAPPGIRLRSNTPVQLH